MLRRCVCLFSTKKSFFRSSFKYLRLLRQLPRNDGFYLTSWIIGSSPSFTALYFALQRDASSEASQGTSFASKMLHSLPKIPLHHAAHTAHATHIRHWRRFFFFINNGSFCGQKHSGYRCRIFEGTSCNLCRVYDTGFEHINKFTV